MSEIGKEFGWTGPGKYVTREGKVFSVVATGDSERAFVGFLQNGAASSWNASGVCGFAPSKYDLIAPYVPPREKLRGWLNCYGGYYRLHKSQREAEELAGENRIACFYVEETTPPEDGE